MRLHISSKITPMLVVVIITILSSFCFPRGAWASTGQQQQTASAGSSSSSSRPPVVVPLIDLSCSDDDQLAREISLACSTIGFFQVKSHGISDDLIQRFRKQCELYFDLSHQQKKGWKRNSSNSRGYFDDELTKQKRDWKECLDVGVPGSRNWDIPDDSLLNACLDGFNQFPSAEELPHFRETIVEYFNACAKLSDRISRLMARGMGLIDNDPFITDLKEQHSSYLRLNYYPPCHHPSKHQQGRGGEEEETKDNDNDENDLNSNSNHPLGISPHKDAGFLTVLLQDDDCHSLQAMIDGEWVSMNPTPGAFTINTGDMAQIWSNNKYKAPLHRVLTNPKRKRYSAPFFYNPGYKTFVDPVVSAAAAAAAPTTTTKDPRNSSSSGNSMKKYDPVLWGYFRAVRFAGDLTNLGVEIQIEDFETTNKIPSAHLARQETFYDKEWHGVPFDVEAYRELLQRHPD